MTKATGGDAPVVFASQSYMGLSPTDPLEVAATTYAALMKTLER
jgi:hypothetical protein